MSCKPEILVLQIGTEAIMNVRTIQEVSREDYAVELFVLQLRGRVESHSTAPRLMRRFGR